MTASVFSVLAVATWGLRRSSQSYVDVSHAQGELVWTVCICEQSTLCCTTKICPHHLTESWRIKTCSVSRKKTTKTCCAEHKDKATKMKHEKAVGHPQAEVRSIIGTGEFILGPSRGPIAVVPGIVEPEAPRVSGLARETSRPLKSNDTVALADSISFGSGFYHLPIAAPKEPAQHTIFPGSSDGWLCR